MIRRQFLEFVTLAGVGGLTSVSRANPERSETISFRIEGFTCLTCAVGLETVLMRKKGILAAKATYPEALATITYDQGHTSIETITADIESMGFHPLPLAPPAH